VVEICKDPVSNDELVVLSERAPKLPEKAEVDLVLLVDAFHLNVVNLLAFHIIFADHNLAVVFDEVEFDGGGNFDEQAHSHCHFVAPLKPRRHVHPDSFPLLLHMLIHCAMVSIAIE